jgi:hypothetical protein
MIIAVAAHLILFALFGAVFRPVWFIVIVPVEFAFLAELMRRLVAVFGPRLW